MNRIPVPKLHTFLQGRCLQIPFEYKGYPLWIGADYYQSEIGFLVHYKVGMEGSWLATRIDYESNFANVYMDSPLPYSAEEIENAIRKHLQENMEQAGDRYLRSAYNFVDMRHSWKENGNEKFAEQFKAFPKYHYHQGERDSVYALIKQGDTDVKVFGHMNESGTGMDLLCSYGGFDFVKFCTLPVHEGMDIGQAILDIEKDKHEAFWDTVRSGEVAASVRGIAYSVEQAEELYGRLDMWNY